MSHKQSIVFPTELYIKLAKAAEARGLSFNRYVIQQLRGKNDAVFINLQEMTQALIQLQQLVLADTRYDDYVRLEVERLCRFCASFLVQIIKKQG
ncbi:hypothetical protein KL86SPO_50346 [uncultured Sporomusa sp.]|uniref:Uncharacterized protein n=1 Tax=uncultured Sporomusa sp. TaxID=307249 RepID=A0A212LYA4_9FIRM|nr:hypothetical protein [uncultured Sporomusa sp.]SCM82575.1 hypothetical protein KL86SPO_50346 [uncultured Sporomusa sp.]